MGVLTNVKEVLAKRTASLARKGADVVASSSALSRQQVADIERRKQIFLAEKPDMKSDDIQDLIEKNLGMAGIEIYQAYLQQLKQVYLPLNVDFKHFTEKNRIRTFEILKWVNDSEEKNLDKLVNVYQVMSEEDCNIALIYNRTIEGCTVSIGVANTNDTQTDPSKVQTYIERLAGAVKGNFPGVELKAKEGETSYNYGIPACLANTDDEKNGTKSVAIVSNLASEKSEGFISQSIEKLLDGIVPRNQDEEYTIVLLAKPIIDQLSKKNRLFRLYSSLAPYASWQTNYTFNQTEGINSTANFGVNLGVSAGVQGSVALAAPKLQPEQHKEDTSDNKVKKLAGGLAKGFGQYSTIQDTNSEINTTGYQAGTNFGVNFFRSSNVNVQVGVNDGIIQNYVNYGVQHTLDIIENKLKRIEESSALGMWEFACYVISNNPVISNNVAHMYLALTQGEASYMTCAAVNLYDGEEEKEQAEIILQSVQRLQHPIFALNDTLDDSWLLYPTLITPSTDLSGKELAKALNFPRKSVGGLPVLNSTAFGREVQKYTEGSQDKDGTCISIGNIYHMRNDEKAPVNLDVISLASHVFVTGSTGTGKSNAIYQIIDKLDGCGVKFMVIEPAKGEYKKVFGGLCSVYGTNSSQTELLAINPFSFQKGIHVLEHIDRLVEIFNACWPMYAAMPAVLKDAIEKCYEKKGWNLRYSKCEPFVFPTFSDLMEVLPEVMNNSLYSTDTKSDYAGALLTRVQSLTNGINGQIFCSNTEISNEDLFEKNVIIDLSRVGSNETKSLMMGILVMKLQEYRLDLGEMNAPLKHVTILEEAHNLLRKTSIDQSQEGANLQGKSVEMITNSIAEMRTYGEGFIIADQAPNLLDAAVIRNTNTKIVLRLPDETDRKTVGTSMALTDNQILELSKLPKGVAAIYQNDWVEAVLCHFEKFDKVNPLEYVEKDYSELVSNFLKIVFGVNDNKTSKIDNPDVIHKWIRGLKNSEYTLSLLELVVDGKTLSDKDRSVVAYNIFEGKKMASILLETKENQKGIERVNQKIKTYLGATDNILIESVRKYIMQAIFTINTEGELYQRYMNPEDIRRVK